MGKERETGGEKTGPSWSRAGAPVSPSPLGDLGRSLLAPCRQLNSPFWQTLSRATSSVRPQLELARSLPKTNPFDDVPNILWITRLSWRALAPRLSSEV